MGLRERGRGGLRKGEGGRGGAGHGGECWAEGRRGRSWGGDGVFLREQGKGQLEGRGDTAVLVPKHGAALDGVLLDRVPLEVRVLVVNGFASPTTRSENPPAPRASSVFSLPCIFYLLPPPDAAQPSSGDRVPPELRGRRRRNFVPSHPACPHAPTCSFRCTSSMSCGPVCRSPGALTARPGSPTSTSAAQPISPRVSRRPASKISAPCRVDWKKC